MAKTATCNACGEEVWFDAYTDINNNVVNTFGDWVCTGCDASGKYADSGAGYSVKEDE